MDDVAENILARLDVEDVLRCKSVCKSWYDLVSSDYFVKAHLKRSYNNNHEHGYIRIRFHGMIINVTMIGSCDGLACLYFNDGKVLVTNPSTQELRKLSMLPYKYRIKVCCWGFGYDSCTNDYKVVAGFNQSKHHMRFQVLSLKSNKWKFVRECDYLTYNTNTYDPISGFLYDGALHWFMDDTKKKKSVILSFDLSLEKFKEIPLPSDTEYVCDDRNRLGIFEERLCILRNCDIYDSYCQRIWVMKNYNCWQQLTRDYEINKYVAYELHNIPDNIWRLYVDDELFEQSWFYIVDPIFVKSLVSLWETKEKEE